MFSVFFRDQNTVLCPPQLAIYPGVYRVCLGLGTFKVEHLCEFDVIFNLTLYHIYYRRNEWFLLMKKPEEKSLMTQPL